MMIYIYNMRTTLTINNTIDSRLRKIAETQHRSYKDIINEALASGLQSMEITEPAAVYKAKTFDFGLKEGIDETKFNQIYDELESGE